MKLQARYNIDKSWYVSAYLENVFNKLLSRRVYGYNILGRMIDVSLGWKQHDQSRIRRRPGGTR